MARTRSTGLLPAVLAAAATEISNNEEGGDQSHQFWQGGVAETTPQHGKDRQSYFGHERQQHQHQRTMYIRQADSITATADNDNKLERFTQDGLPKEWGCAT